MHSLWYALLLASDIFPTGLPSDQLQMEVPLGTVCPVAWSLEFFAENQQSQVQNPHR